MFSPLIDDIIKRENISVVNEGNVDEFAQKNGDVILFIGGDPDRLVLVHDVAVILPELVKASNGGLKPAILERDSERALQRRYRFSSFPSLVFLRDGEYLGVISGVLDWTDYVVQINEILAKEPSEPPAFKMPEGCDTPAPSVDASAQQAPIVNKLIEKGADNV